MPAPTDDTDTDTDFYCDDERDLCHFCGGAGSGVVGDDWDNDDPINVDDGTFETCPCCGGSGRADDCTFW